MRRSINVIVTSAFASVRAAARPPNPPPMITTCGRDMRLGCYDLPLPSRLASITGRLTRWVAPSAVAASIGALVAGLFEGASADLGQTVATVGFFAILALPVLFVGGLIVRGLIRAWRPRVLLEGLVEETGGAPRLVGWLVLLGVACGVMAVAIYRGTWMLADGTELHAMTVSFVEPVIAVSCAIVLFAISRPAVAAISHLARAADRRWRRGGRSTLLRPRAIVIATAALITLITAITWFAFVKPRLGPFDTSIVYAPLIAVAIATLGHAGYARLNRRFLVGAGAGVLALGAVGFALVTRATRPSLAIEIWGERPLAGAAVDVL